LPKIFGFAEWVFGDTKGLSPGISACAAERIVAIANTDGINAAIVVL
jgi:hypothetical protein